MSVTPAPLENATDTPRTDGMLTYLAAGVHPNDIPHSWVEPMALLARQLEREVAAVRHDLEKAMRNHLGDLAEIAEARDLLSCGIDETVPEAIRRRTATPCP